MILGIDEVGRGPWAGPLVVGAVVLGDEPIAGLTDSKKLSARRRAALNEEIQAKALGWGLGWVHADELDQVGLAEALRLATIRAVEHITAPYHEIIIDGTINFLKETNKGKYVTTLAKADLLIPSVSAASIVAKVARDAYMAEQDAQYPEYSFGQHVGYGTALHLKALQAHGVTALHRRSFAPIAKLLGSGAPTIDDVKPTTKSIGNRAEDKATAFLTAQSHQILNRNWKTRWCEIDIISKKDSVTYFVEVKYRSSSRHGGALAAITPKKLQQMRFAAELYAARHRVAQPQLAVLTLTAQANPLWLEVE